MKKASLFLACLGVLSTLPALASQELTNLIRCHEALDGKADARTFKLTTDSATPFEFSSGKKLYFVTDESIGVLENKYADKSLVIRLDEKKQPFYRVLNFQKNGTLGNVSFQEPTKEQKAHAETPSAQLDKSLLDLLKKELIRQMNSVTSEYQNKYDPAGTIESLNVCRKVDSPEMQKSIDKQIAFYEKLVRKNGGKGSYQNKSSGTK
ncbi:hypothetical protein [Bdellovibrio sp. BCCA]|uniref:hypothetical protein n=1 Tax=Bdellovibrio sp. BCCA TaxID=3136281 RepID=UPI0030F275DF